MTYGRVALCTLCRLTARFAAFYAAFALLYAPGSAPAAPVKSKPALPHPASGKIKSATFLSADEEGVHLRLADGSTMDAELRPSSLFLKEGLAATPSDFKAGDPVRLRTRTRAGDGAVWVVLLCDPATEAAVETYRKKTLTGTVQSMDDKILVVKPSDNARALPIMLHVTPKTLFRKGGVDVTPSAFAPGQTVTIITRGLPSGLLMAAIVSDRGGDAVQEKAFLKPVTVSGIAVSTQAAENTLTLFNKKTKTRQTLAVTDETRIKIRKQAAALTDITAGMRVTARLGHTKDGAGHPLATSLSAFDGAASRVKKAGKVQP